MSHFTPRRLDLARRRRGFTKTELAERLGITPRALTFYLAGEREPAAEIIDRMAVTLEFPLGFFSAPDIVEPSLDGVSFRSLSTMSARQRDQAVGAAAIAVEIDDWIRDRFELPRPDVPRLRRADPEAAAEAVRDAWGLGQKRAPNMIHLLEKHGVRVYSLNEDCKEVDAFSFWRDEVPFVFLNTMKTPEHSRMDAAHELGHLVLHAWGGPSGRAAEEDAKAFGSAFLLPRASVLAEAPRPGNVKQILKAKHKWNVSAMALAYRMAKLNILSEWQARTIYKQLGQMGYRSGEPDTKEKPRETSQILAKVFDALRDDCVSRAAVAKELAITTKELNSVIFGLVLTPLPAGRSGASAERAHATDHVRSREERPNLRLV